MTRGSSSDEIVRSAGPTYRFDCPVCSKTWDGHDISNIAECVAWHWNKEHNGELRGRYKRIDTVERGGHHLHGNEYSVERIPIYVTAFDVMERIGLEDGLAVPPETGNVCDECLRFLRQHHEHEQLEESVIGNDVWRCRSCADKLKTRKKKEQNQQLHEFVPDGGQCNRRHHASDTDHSGGEH